MNTLSATPTDGLSIEPISADRLAAVMAKATSQRQAVISVLEADLSESPYQFIRRLALTVGYPIMEMGRLREIVPAFDLLPFAESTRSRCLVYREAGRVIGVVVDPFDLALRTKHEAALGPIDWHLVHVDDLVAYLSQQEDQLKAVGAETHLTGAPSVRERTSDELSLTTIANDASPVVRLVNSTIYDAVKTGASDIHFESTATGLRVKYRIDGVLTSVMVAPGTEASERAVSRLKVMAELDIAEKRIPQDGRFKLAMKGYETDFRVSVMPSSHGEDVVVRILDKKALTDQFDTLNLERLGFDEASLAVIRKMTREPYGMILVTGPTGSGKTTTLYAALSEINHGHEKIITIEDPVEYQLPGILQIPVNEKKGLTFAKGLRSILRHDPDKILVGEIRDAETAQIAIQSALTGHLVFTSVHANNAFDVLGRFLHMGVDLYSFVSALNGIVAQRLVRLNCPQCSVDVEYALSELSDSGIPHDRAPGMQFRKGQGCGHCRGTGYRGRSAIAEVLRLNDEMRELIETRQSIKVLKEAAYSGGTQLLRKSAINLLAAGKTTLEEINRVTFVA